MPPAPYLVPHLFQQYLRKVGIAKKVTAAGMAVSGSLALAKLIIGWLAHSTAVFADGIENVGDLFGSGLILYALFVASKPPDKEHPYGHGRSETIAGLAVGFLLGASGIGICYESFRRLHVTTETPQFYAIWPLEASILVKTGLSFGKFTFGRRLQSAARNWWSKKSNSDDSLWVVCVALLIATIEAQSGIQCKVSESARGRAQAETRGPCDGQAPSRIG